MQLQALLYLLVKMDYPSYDGKSSISFNENELTHFRIYILKMQDIINEVKSLNEDCKAEN